MSELTGCELDAVRLIAGHLRLKPGADDCMARIYAAMEQRQQAGIAEYGQPLAQNFATLKERLQHLWEELLDAQAYAAWIRRSASPFVPGAEQQAVECAYLIHRTLADCLYETDKAMQMLKRDEET